MLTPFDDYPIHSSADPVGVPASGDPNHYDRYWFNGHQRDGDRQARQPIDGACW